MPRLRQVPDRKCSSLLRNKFQKASWRLFKFFKLARVTLANRMSAESGMIKCWPAGHQECLFDCGRVFLSKQVKIPATLGRELLPSPGELFDRRAVLLLKLRLL